MTQPVTVVSGTFVERVNPNGSSLVVKLVGGGTVAQGGVDPSNAKQMLATPATPLGSGSYLVQWTTVSLDDGELARGTWTFTVAVAPSASATPVRERDTGFERNRRAVGCGDRPAVVAATVVPASTGPTPAAIGRRRHDGEWQRRRGPDHRGAHRAGRRRSLSPQPTQPPDDPDAPDAPTTTDAPDDTDVIPRLAARLASGLAVAIGLALVLPAAVAAHALNPTYTSRLPLAVYLVGAATAVALSFAFVIVRDVRAAPPDLTSPGTLPPAWLRIGLRVIGLIGWLWIIGQGIAGGASDGEVATLFLWNYGWVGLAIICAIIGPAWHFLDPFSTIHDVGGLDPGAAHVQGWEPADYPERLGRWPGTIGFAVFVWLELVMQAGPTLLFVVLVGYTAYTLAMMAQFGRDEWRSRGETFTVWFRLLGRLAWFRLVDEEGRVHRRSFGSGLLEPGWTGADVTLVAFGVSSIIFDGLSQTQAFFDVFGAPGVPIKTLILFAWLGLVVLLAFAVARTVGLGAVGAGLLPIALGYLIAHYLTYLLIDGQRILIAISDPFQKGWDLFGTAFWQPSGAWLPPGLVWTIQLAAVVGGHMLGAWGGHVVAAADAPPGIGVIALRRRQLPLAVVMVGLTTLTLWSLGQAILVTPAAALSDRATAPQAGVAVRTAAGTSCSMARTTGS